MSSIVLEIQNVKQAVGIKIIKQKDKESEEKKDE